jgi:hypothetical protein
MKRRTRSARDAASAQSLRKIFELLNVTGFRRRLPRLREKTQRKQYTFDTRHLDAGLVLADALEEQGYEHLGRVLSRRIHKIQKERLVVERFNPYDNALLRRVKRAIETVEKRKKDLSRSVKKGRTRAEQPELRSSYDYFRKHGANAASAMSLARAEQFFFTHDWTFNIQPEEESYQSVYGRNPENAKIEREHDFVYVNVADSRGRVREGVGMVVADKDNLRWERANLMLESMPSRRRSR